MAKKKLNEIKAKPKKREINLFKANKEQSESYKIINATD